ncbi:MAG: magnesium transporter [Nanopusillaceae archaeon]
MNIEFYKNKVLEDIKKEDIEKIIEIFDSLPPQDAIEVLSRLDEKSRNKIYAFSSLNNVSKALDCLSEEILNEIIIYKGIDYFLNSIKDYSLDKLSEILLKLSPKKRKEILDIMPKEIKEEIKKILKYPEESAGSIMTTLVPVFNSEKTVEEVIETYIKKLENNDYDEYNKIYVVDNNFTLIGSIDFTDLLTKEKKKKIVEVVDPVNIYIEPYLDREEVVKLAIKYNLSEIPVLDNNKRFLGVISVKNLLNVMIKEHSEDLLKYGGFIETLKGKYVSSSPLKIAIKRIPMIVYLYLINLITGGITVFFENIISKIAVLAAFMPMLADNSGNIGSQSSVLILRSLITGELKISKKDLLHVILKEFIVTSTMLFFLAPIAFSIGLIIPLLAKFSVDLSLKIATVVTLALAVSCYVSDIIGSLLPIVLAKLKIDPATASAPIVTSIGDITAVTVYFTIASIFL